MYDAVLLFIYSVLLLIYIMRGSKESMVSTYTQNPSNPLNFLSHQSTTIFASAKITPSLLTRIGLKSISFIDVHSSMSSDSETSA